MTLTYQVQDGEIYMPHNLGRECPLFFGWKIIGINNLVNVYLKKKKTYDINKIVIFKISSNIFDKVANNMSGDVYL